MTCSQIIYGNHTVSILSKNCAILQRTYIRCVRRQKQSYDNITTYAARRCIGSTTTLKLPAPVLYIYTMCRVIRVKGTYDRVPYGTCSVFPDIGMAPGHINNTMSPASSDANRNNLAIYFRVFGFLFVSENGRGVPAAFDA